mgnify:CR=1 FL=1
MFTIIENTFLDNGVVKYADDAGNTLRITGDKAGKKLSIKLRFSKELQKKINLKINTDVIRIEMPYKDEGINFPIKYEGENVSDIKTDNFLQGKITDVLQDTIYIIQNWIVISELLAALVSERMKDAALIICKDNGLDADNEEIRDSAIQALTVGVLQELSCYEEMTDLMKCYIEILKDTAFYKEVGKNGFATKNI